MVVCVRSVFIVLKSKERNGKTILFSEGGGGVGG